MDLVSIFNFWHAANDIPAHTVVEGIHSLKSTLHQIIQNFVSFLLYHDTNFCRVGDFSNFVKYLFPSE